MRNLLVLANALLGSGRQRPPLHRLRAGLSVPLALEYEATCRDPAQRIVSGLSEAEVEAVVAALRAVAEPVTTRFLWRPQLHDPADEMVLDTAINGAADALVTFNRKDFGPATDPRCCHPRGVEETVAAMKKQLSTYPLRLPTSLKAAVAELSRADGTSINQFVTTAVAEKVSALRTVDFFATRAAQADIKEARRLLRRSGGQMPAPEDRLEQPTAADDDRREGTVPEPKGQKSTPA